MSVDDRHLIRRATTADGQALADLRSLWRMESHQTPIGNDGTFGLRFTDWFEAQLASGSLAWVAEDPHAVGMLVMFVHERMPEPGRESRRWGYIGNVFVHHDGRDRGVGRSLVAAAVEEARSQGFARLVLNPSPRSVPLYERAGFSGNHALLTLELD